MRTALLVAGIAVAGAPAQTTALARLQSKDVRVRLTAARELVAAGAKVLPGVVSLLGHERHAVRRSAVDVLARIGGAAVPRLVVLIERGTERERKGAALALRRIGDPAVGALLAVLRRHDGEAARWATWALRPSAKSIAELVNALATGDACTRDIAERALGRIGTGAVARVIPLLRHSKPLVRRSAAWVMAAIGPPAAPAVPHLVPLLSERKATVHLAAKTALGKIGDVAIPDLVKALLASTPADRSGRLAADALVLIGSPARAALERAKREGSEHATSLAVGALRRLRR